MTTQINRFTMERKPISSTAIPPIGQIIRETSDIAGYLLHLNGQNSNEFLHAFFLDESCRLTWSETIARGSVGSVEIDIRNLLTIAIRVDAIGLILGHNHPSGASFPSEIDIRAAHRLRSICAPVGIKVLDHLIVGKDRCFSFLAERLM